MGEGFDRYVEVRQVECVGFRHAREEGLFWGWLPMVR